MRKPMIIPHTHWDREWIITADVTSRWLHGLFERLFKCLDSNPNYRFTLDGQCLVIEDYLEYCDNAENVLENLRKHASKIALGPYYAQIDWRMGEETLIRNLWLGIQIAEGYGRTSKAGFLVDNFGFPSQLAQIHEEFGINSLMLWRGVDFPDEEIKTEFILEGPDGSRVLCVFLLDGYRNVMRLCDYPEVAVKRVDKKLKLLSPFCLSGFPPLMDGYDLDPFAEDPQQCVQASVVTIDEFMENIRNKLKTEQIPVHKGEMISGRLACVFPGTLSTRPHLKVMNWYVEQWISKVLEPLAAISHFLTGECREFVKEWKEVVKNLVHDSICGVGVDQVHRDMERRYSNIRRSILEHADEILDEISPFLPGGYSAFNTNPHDCEIFVENGEHLLHFYVPAGGLHMLEPEEHKIRREEEDVETFTWCNEHFRFVADPEGMFIERAGKRYPLNLRMVEDNGDGYSSDFGKALPLHFRKIKVLEKTDVSAKLSVEYSASEVEVGAEIFLSSHPLVEFRFDLRGKGAGYAVLLELEGEGKILAGAPFDVVERERVIRYEKVSDFLKPFLVAAREVDECRIFPMKDFVAFESGKQMIAFLAKGIYSYAVLNGSLSLILSRSVSWISKKDIGGRVGDAGPRMYIPGAEMKRRFVQNVALYAGDTRNFFKWKASYINPPILFKSENDHNPQGFKLYEGDEYLCFSTMGFLGVLDSCVVRFYNPTCKEAKIKFKIPVRVARMSEKVEPSEEIFEDHIAPKKIKTYIFSHFPTPMVGNRKNVKLLSPLLKWEIGEDEAVPDPTILQTLKKESERLNAEGEKYLQMAEQVEGFERYKNLFNAYCRLREAKELELSYLLNTGASKESVSRVAEELNNLRVKRRSVEMLIAALKEG
ncbi:MAG: hypothetical protein J7L52_04360 [Thermotogae bacterium]|nr:hypothetical protein [Thermotogota bacterium]